MDDAVPERKFLGFHVTSIIRYSRYSQFLLLSRQESKTLMRIFWKVYHPEISRESHSYH